MKHNEDNCDFPYCKDCIHLGYKWNKPRCKCEDSEFYDYLVFDNDTEKYEPVFRLYYREYYCIPEYCEYDDELHYFEENYVFLTKWIPTEFATDDAYEMQRIMSRESKKHRSEDNRGVRWGRHYAEGENYEGFIEEINNRLDQ